MLVPPNSVHMHCKLQLYVLMLHTYHPMYQRTCSSYHHISTMEHTTYVPVNVISFIHEVFVVSLSSGAVLN